MKYFSLFWLQLKTSNIQYTAAALTFITLLALVPLLSIMRMLSHLIPFLDYFTDGFVIFVNQVLLPYVDQFVEQSLLAFKQRASQLSYSGIILLIIVSIMLAQTIETAFNKIWKIKQKRKIRNRIGLYVLLTFIGPLIIGLGIFILQWLNENTNFNLSWLFSWLSSALLLSITYFIFPHQKIKVKQSIIVSLIISALILFSRFIFTFYLQSVDFYNFIYGKLAIIPFFLIWLNLFWILILIGAVMIKFLTQISNNKTL